MTNKLIRRGRLWQIEHNRTLPENIRQAICYYASKYGETFEAVAMRPETRATILAETCHELKLLSDTSVTPGCLFFVRE
jgi:hypothetical protein